MSIDPKILRRMQNEDTFLQSQTKGSRRVKLDRGQSWIVRFLPARMGPDGLWFARIAKHWVNRLPIVCARLTAEDFGGDPDFHCPVCDLADELNDSADEVISKFGFKAKANPQFLTYCVVWEKNNVQQPMSEVLVPYEFNHYRSTYEELKGFYVTGGRRCPDSVLDYKFGCDFSVIKTGKGMRLGKLDASPIFDLKDPKWDEHIKKLEAHLKTPKVVIPTAEQLHVFVKKMQEAADRGGVVDDDDDRPRRQRGGYADEEADFRRGSRRRAEPQEEDDLPYDEPPQRSRAAAAPSRRAEPESDSAREPEEPSQRRRPAPADDDPQPRRRAPEAEDEPPRRRAAEPEYDEPPRRGPAAREEEPEPAPRRRTTEPEDGEPRRRREDDEPAPRRRTEEAAEPEQPRRRREAEPEPEPAPRRRAAEEPEPVRRPRGEDPEPHTPRDDAEPERPTGDPEPEDPERPASRRVAPTGRGGLPPTERQAAARREAASSAPQGESEEEDPLPEDDKDNVLPAPKLDADGGNDVPPPVARRGSQGADIKARLEKLGRNA